jgi:anti-sigma factor ChrR (cupin superfamily)
MRVHAGRDATFESPIAIRMGKGKRCADLLLAGAVQCALLARASGEPVPRVREVGHARDPVAKHYFRVARGAVERAILPGDLPRMHRLVIHQPARPPVGQAVTVLARSVRQ